MPASMANAQQLPQHQTAAPALILKNVAQDHTAYLTQSTNAALLSIPIKTGDVTQIQTAMKDLNASSSTNLNTAAIRPTPAQ